MRKKIQKKINFFKYSNCFQANEKQILKGYKFFLNDNPIILELGCGKASFSLQLARNYPKKNFIAVDTKINRLSDGAKIAIHENLQNIIFLQMHIEQILLHFDYHSIDTIWLTFPDPYPKDRHEKHRLTNLKFLNYYHYLLKNDGLLFFKTDNKQLFDYTLSLLKRIHWLPLEYTYDLYNSELLNSDNSIPTDYEKLFVSQGKKIHFLSLKNCDKPFENIPLEPIPVFSPIRSWIPNEKIWNLEPLNLYKNFQNILIYEEYDINMQFARTPDFEKFFWILVKGEVCIEFVKKNHQAYCIKFNHFGDKIDVEVHDFKIYAITIQRTLLVKIPRNIEISINNLVH